MVGSFTSKLSGGLVFVPDGAIEISNISIQRFAQKLTRRDGSVAICRLLVLPMTVMKNTGGYPTKLITG